MLNIIHVDMDAFYASCEELDDAALAGKPVVVGGSEEERGVVCSANYKARRLGVRSAMPAANARRLAPGAAFIRPRIERYLEISRKVFEIFFSYTPLVEPLSIDEAFLDVSGCERLFGDAAAIAGGIRDDIKTKIGITASAGIAPNKFLAKLASGLEKPDGFVIIREDEIRDVLDPLPVSKIWGVGKVTAGRLEALGIKTVRQLRETDARILEREFGSLGGQLATLSRGEDDRVVEAATGRESIGKETTFAMNLTDSAEMERVLLTLSDKVAARLRKKDLWARVVQVKCRFADFTTVTRRSTLPEWTRSTDEIYGEALRLFRGRVRVPRGGVRLLGVSVAHLSDKPEGQMNLFPSGDRKRMELIDAAVDKVRELAGTDKIGRASTLAPPSISPRGPRRSTSLRSKSGGRRNA